MKPPVEKIMSDFFDDEVRAVGVPAVPEILRRRRGGRLEAGYAVLAAAACLSVIIGGGRIMPPSALAESATRFARMYEVGTTVTRGLEIVKEAAKPVFIQGEDK